MARPLREDFFSASLRDLRLRVEIIIPGEGKVILQEYGGTEETNYKLFVFP